MLQRANPPAAHQHRIAATGAHQHSSAAQQHSSTVVQQHFGATATTEAGSIRCSNKHYQRPKDHRHHRGGRVGRTTTGFHRVRGGGDPYRHPGVVVVTPPSYILA